MKILWDRRTVGRGSPLGPDDIVIEVDARTLLAAHAATDPDFARYDKVEGVRRYVEGGGRLSLPEVGVVEGRLGFTNGRNRARLAADLGGKVPVVVSRANAAEFRALLAKFNPSAPISFPAPNVLLRDAMVRHAIYVNRYAGGVVKDVAKILDESQKELADLLYSKLRTGGLTAANAARVQRLEAAVRELRDGPWRDARGLLLERAVELAKAEPEFMADALRRVTPVVMDTIIPSASVLRQLVKDPIQGHGISDWFRSIQQRDARGIMGAVRMGMVQSETVDQMVGRALASTGLSRNHAVTLVRTAVNEISNAARQEFFEHNSELIKEEEFVATLDGRTTPICMANDGKRFPIGEGPIPALHFNCRSIRVPVLDGQEVSSRPSKGTTEAIVRREFEDLKAAGNSPGPYRDFRRKKIRDATEVVASNLSYNEWLSTQSNVFQDEVLGPARAKLFRQGVSVDKFVSRQGDELTLPELRKRHADAFKAAGL